MKSKIFTFLLFAISFQSYSFSKFIIPINVVPSEAEIWVDGKLIGVGSVTITLKDAKVFNLVIQSNGYVSEKIDFKFMKKSDIEKGLNKTLPIFKNSKVYSRGTNDVYNFTLQKESIIPIEYLTEKDVFEQKKITFYGYDFSNFQLADAKRMGQDLKKYLFTLTGFYIEHLSETKLAKWLDKQTVIYNFNPTMIVNKKINNDDIASPIKHTINKDSLQLFINKYALTEKEGIGYVIIYECFDSYTKRVSAYSAFFDIATRKILIVEYVSHRDGNSYNRLSDWSPASFSAIKDLTDLYKEKYEASIKATGVK